MQYKLFNKIIQAPKKLFYLSRKEEAPKTVWKRSYKKAILRSLASLNFKGYFWGSRVAGNADRYTQQAAVLGLQVAAKALELVIGSSLSLTIIDIVRFMLTRSDHGLPLGMAPAGQSFTTIKYFFTFKFWGAVKGLPRSLGTWFICIWLISSGVIIALVGPATALLVVPTGRAAWQAGAAYFNAVGDKATLFPVNLDGDSDGGPLCRSPSIQRLNRPARDDLGCPWSGYPTILAALTQWASNLMVYPGYPIPFFEWQQERHVLQNPRAPGHAAESWTIASQPAFNVWSGSLDLAWRGAITNVGQLSPAANFKFATGKTTYIPTSFPAVRTVCHYQGGLESRRDFKFPLVEPFQIWTGRLFTLPKELAPTTLTGIEWISMPKIQVRAADNSAMVNAYGSALLVAQVPKGPNGVPASLMTCCIDARWAPGVVIADGAIRPVLDPNHLRQPSGKLAGYDESGSLRPKDDGSWQQITIEPKWLHTLTPVMENADGKWNTMTPLFEASGLINGTVKFPNLETVYGIAESAVSTLVADGVSRIGIRYQVGNPTIDACFVDPKDYGNFFSGAPENPSYTYPPPYGVSNTNQTRMRWYITIPGLSYKADNAASRLALSLLFI
ncbi:unnamed protein product [Clonostachys byssicola]|uniref:Uncharacterized protein n=1 Tax=Clonostachys byssicola TaxID=160290 RepID=A0A9N9UKM7_9HYPO|nr:unnamed protein product [Clonostachys byssicola]